MISVAFNINNMPHFTFQEGGPMATTRIIAMHAKQGRTIAQCLTDRKDYAIDSGKTEDGK